MQACVDLPERYITDRSFPDKAIDVMDEAGSRIHIQDIPVPEEIQALERRVDELQTLKNDSVKKQNFELAADYRDQLKQVEDSLVKAKKEWEDNLGDERATVDEFIIADVVSAMTGIPVQRMGSEENSRLRNLKQALQQSVVLARHI